MEEVYPNLGLRLKYFRTRARVSQLDLEISIGSAPGSLSRIESGVNNPTKETIYKIANRLQLNFLEISYLIGRLKLPATHKEILWAKDQVKTLFREPGVFAYILDDRFRMIETSDSFIKLLGLSREQVEKCLMVPVIELCYKEEYGLRKFFAEQEFDELMYNLLLRSFVENSFMADDEIIIRTIKLIKSEAYLLNMWNRISTLNPQVNYFSDLTSRKVTFKFMGIKIPMYYTNELLFGNEKFYLVEYIPTNKLLKWLSRLT